MFCSIYLLFYQSGIRIILCKNLLSLSPFFLTKVLRIPASTSLLSLPSQLLLRPGATQKKHPLLLRCLMSPWNASVDIPPQHPLLIDDKAWLLCYVMYLHLKVKCQWRGDGGIELPTRYIGSFWCKLAMITVARATWQWLPIIPLCHGQGKKNERGVPTTIPTSPFFHRCFLVFFDHSPCRLTTSIAVAIMLLVIFVKLGICCWHPFCHCI